MSRPLPAAGHETVADVVRQARIEAGYDTVRGFAAAVAKELMVAPETARTELTAIENGRRGVSARYARAISKLTGVPLSRLRSARPPADTEQILAAVAELAGAVTELAEKMDRFLASQDGHSKPVRRR